MAARSATRRRTRGEIETLPSGSLRVRVYAGIDPVSKRRHFLTETVPAGPNAEREAERARTRLLAELDERRQPRTQATLRQLLDRHLDALQKSGKVGPSTLSGYRGYVKRHITPLIGDLKVGTVDAYTLDSFYAELARCQDHCDRKQRGRGQHGCRPLGDATILKIHYLLSGAYRRAVRWGWVGVSPIAQAEPPAPPPPDPQPPTAEEAARIVNEAWSNGRGHADPDFGALVWLAMTVGARRGELCALQWRHVGLNRGVLVIRQAVASDGAGTWYIKDTKTHQRRRVTLDPPTVEVLQEHRQRCEERADALGSTLDADAFVFSLVPDHSEFLIPASVTQRYRRLVTRLGIDTHFHALRHYSATELIAAGVDVRTVAGRLGHGGGGITTLRVYSAWREEADQRAASTLSARMPARPAVAPDPIERAKTAPRSPYQRIAAELRERILSGSLRAGSLLPPVKQIAAEAKVSVGTGHRAIELLAKWNLVDIQTSRRTVVRDTGSTQGARSSVGWSAPR